eukprot:353324_1
MSARKKKSKSKKSKYYDLGYENDLTSYTIKDLKVMFRRHAEYAAKYPDGKRSLVFAVDALLNKELKRHKRKWKQRLQLLTETAKTGWNIMLMVSRYDGTQFSCRAGEWIRNNNISAKTLVTMVQDPNNDLMGIGGFTYEELHCLKAYILGHRNGDILSHEAMEEDDDDDQNDNEENAIEPINPNANGRGGGGVGRGHGRGGGGVGRGRGYGRGGGGVGCGRGYGRGGGVGRGYGRGRGMGYGPVRGRGMGFVRGGGRGFCGRGGYGDMSMGFGYSEYQTEYDEYGVSYGYNDMRMAPPTFRVISDDKRIQIQRKYDGELIDIILAQPSKEYMESTVIKKKNLVQRLWGPVRGKRFKTVRDDNPADALLRLGKVLGQEFKWISRATSEPDGIHLKSSVAGDETDGDDTSTSKPISASEQIIRKARGGIKPAWITRNNPVVMYEALSDEKKQCIDKFILDNDFSMLNFISIHWGEPAVTKAEQLGLLKNERYNCEANDNEIKENEDDWDAW